jgi:hypothetical protein
MTPKESEKLQLAEESQKRVEYHAASYNAWFNTSLEHDKSLLALSAGGIGLLLTLLTTVGLSSAEALVLYISAIICFVVALVAILVVFRRNRTYIENILSGKSTGSDPLLTIFDTTAMWAFGIGVGFTAIIGIAAAIHSYSNKEKTMSNEIVKKLENAPVLESYNNAINLQKSFNNATNLIPQHAASTASPAVITPAPAASSSSQKPSGGGK